MRRHRQKKTKHKKILLWAVIATAIFMAGYFTGHIPPPTFKPANNEVWTYIDEKASNADIDPHFVYAIAMAESSLRPTASTKYARGIMQISPAAWKTVSHLPYRQAWNWRCNVDVGIKYLVYCKRFLDRHHAFSYANLAAAYHYGIGALQRNDFNASNFLPSEKNHIYHALLSGERPPIAIPK